MPIRTLIRAFIISILCLFSISGVAQTPEWWVQTVKWDGVTHWTRYLITQPAYLGPNALPVPRTGNGSPDSTAYIGITGNFHFSKGDNTQNLVVYANYPLVKNVISFDAMWVPYEHFTMSHVTKTERHVFYLKYYDRHAAGDIHLNTNIRLLKKWEEHIHLALRIGYRFPAGGGLGTARYTDGPGYYFDISYGKPLKNPSLKWIGMAGFYTWQMISDKHRQNDAFLFGNGLEWNKNSLRIQTYIAGYLGYLENSGDKPIVFRTTLEKRLKRSSLLLGFQQGLHDFKYSSGEVGIKYHFNR
ncbi:MAG: hypothetical protein JNN00_19645 [Chitinophagaceae bacterium]|nr:hypothetical protein [Chitinophagaceae bacterium]